MPPADQLPRKVIFDASQAQAQSQMPVALLAFANDWNADKRYLRHLLDESKAITRALAPLVRQGFEVLPSIHNATIKDVIEAFRERAHQIRLFHFAGHASSSTLLFEDESGAPSTAHANGLADYLGMNASLVLVFLNGCSTAPQVRRLRAAGLKAVVATTHAIDDAVASVFAETFYAELAVRPLRAAYDAAVSVVQARWGDDPRAVTRHALLDDESFTPSWPWMIDCDPAYEAWSPGHDLEQSPFTVGSTGNLEPEIVHRVAAIGTRRWMFLALLAAVVGLALLFGSGYLHQEAISEYVVFVLLGGLASVLVFLSGATNRDGTPSPTSVRLGGSFIPLGLIVVGGLWSTSRDQSFTFKLKFVDDANQSVNVSGSARLEISGYTILANADNVDLVTFEHIPRALSDRTASLTLDARNHQLAQPQTRYTVVSGGISEVGVKKIAVATVTGTFTFRGERIRGGSVSIAGTDCSAPISDGYFEIPCLPLTQAVVSSEHRIRLQIQMPELYRTVICSREVEAKQFHDNEFTLAECDKPRPPPRPPPLVVCKIDALARPNFWTGERCSNPTAKTGELLTADYKSRFPNLEACTHVVEYSCP